MIETHCHLHHKKFNTKWDEQTNEKLGMDRDDVIKKAMEEGVEAFVEVSIGYDSNFILREKLGAYPNVKYTTGVHPARIWPDAPAMEHWEKHIREFALLPDTVAIGEIGLDHYRSGEENWALQEKWCHTFIELAKEVGKPLVFHFREAHEDAIRILGEHFDKLSDMEQRADEGIRKETDGCFDMKGKVNGVVHCFHGTKKQAKDYLDFGLYLGIGGMLMLDSQMEETIKEIPLERIVLETDSPFLTPPDMEGPNTPLSIPVIAEHLAKLKGVTKEEVDRITTQNAKKLFQL